MNKSQLLEAMQTGHRGFHDLLAELDGADLTQPGVVGAWSVKDLVAHIVIHEQRMLDWVRERLARKLPQAPQPYGMPEQDLAFVNEQIYQANRDRSWGEVVYALDQTYIQALALVSTAQEADLIDPGRLPLQAGEPLWEAVAANTFWHYEEHERDIRSWQANGLTPRHEETSLGTVASQANERLNG